MAITSLMFESQNCSTIDSCIAMYEIHNYMTDNCVSETTKALREAGFVVVEIGDEDEISFDVIF